MVGFGRLWLSSGIQNICKSLGDKIPILGLSDQSRKAVLTNGFLTAVSGES